MVQPWPWDGLSSRQTNFVQHLSPQHQSAVYGHIRESFSGALFGAVSGCVPRPRDSRNLSASCRDALPSRGLAARLAASHPADSLPHQGQQTTTLQRAKVRNPSRLARFPAGARERRVSAFRPLLLCCLLQLHPPALPHRLFCRRPVVLALQLAGWPNQCRTPGQKMQVKIFDSHPPQSG